MIMIISLILIAIVSLALAVWLMILAIKQQFILPAILSVLNGSLGLASIILLILKVLQ